MTLPGITAKHKIITDACRRRGGDEVEEVLDAVRSKLVELYKDWPEGQNTKIHVAVSVEYDADHPY